MNRLAASTLSVAAIITVGTMIGQSGRTPAHADPAPKSVAPITGKWTIDPAHASVEFSIVHLGLDHVTGRFQTVSGSIVADAEHVGNSSVDVTIDASSLDTGNSMRDNDVKSKNYLDVADYPTITFKSTQVNKRHNGQYVAIGNLTIHGVTRTVVLPITVQGPITDPWGAKRAAFSTGVSINRVDYGVGGNDKMSDGSIMIGTDVSITINVETIPAK